MAYLFAARGFNIYDLYFEISNYLSLKQTIYKTNIRNSERK